MGARTEADLFEGFISLNMVGRSVVFIETLSLIRKIAQYEAPVLIQGETGTGKEAAARSIHYLGCRRGQPFIPVNCGAIPDQLLENELFGHERGAFTDARDAQTGLIAQAQGGTLFLDEVDTLSAKAQIALLRFFQDYEYRPLGARGLRKADVRFICAGNADLSELVEQGGFRDDLLFRINVLALRLPSLRERYDDIALLAKHFIHLYSARYHKPIKALHPDTLAWMEYYAWPGNVRELENIIHRSLLLSEGEFVHCEPPDENLKAPAPAARLAGNFNDAKARAIMDFEQHYLVELMRAAHGNITQAARIAGKERRALGKLLKKHGIKREDYSRRQQGTENPGIG